jgi:DNA-binding winged helix-turn-helix (wHTH) protein/TolB-like protein
MRFGGFELDLATGELSRGSKRIKLQRQPAIVLSIMVSGAGRVISRDELRQALWGTETHVNFEQGINWCVRQLRKILGDNVNAPQFIETVAKLGYRFIAPCTAIEDGAWPHEARSARHGWLPWKLVPGAVALLLIIAAAAYHARGNPRTLLVLPLDNYSGETRADALANARTDYLIAALGATNPSQLRVIDRLTAAKFKRTGECIIKIGRQLHADYVFIGSIEASNSGPRLSGGVFRVADNTQVWTTKGAGVSAVSDESVAELPKAIATALGTSQ